MPPRTSSRSRPEGAPGIEDYGLIGDCHSCALVSRWGSIDWCCLPRFDSSSCFARLLDWERGGHWTIQPDLDGVEVSRRYEDQTLVLETRFRAPGGEVVLRDAFAMCPGGRETPRRQILRVVEGVSGELPLVVWLEPRVDYGRLRPWFRRHDERLLTAVAGDTGLVISGDVEFERVERGLAVAPSPCAPASGGSSRSSTSRPRSCTRAASTGGRRRGSRSGWRRRVAGGASGSRAAPAPRGPRRA